MRQFRFEPNEPKSWLGGCFWLRRITVTANTEAHGFQCNDAGSILWVV